MNPPKTTFTDTANREWNICISIAAVKRVRDQLDVLLTDLADPESELFKSLYGRVVDPILLVSILWHLCESQAKNRGLNEEQFAESLGGQSLVDANEALMMAIVNFARPDLREAWSKNFSKNREYSAIFQEAVELGVLDRKIEQNLPPLLKEMIEEVIEQRASKSIKTSSVAAES